MTGPPQSRRRGSYGIDAPYAATFITVQTVAELVLAILSGKAWVFLPVLFLFAIVASYFYTTLRGKFVVWAELLDKLNLWGDERILDLGCGRGAVLLMAVQRLTTGRAVGIDLWRSFDQSGNSAEATRRNAIAEGVTDRVELHTGDMFDPGPDALHQVGWTMTAANDQERPREGINKGLLIRFLVALPVFFTLFMFLPAGTWAWTKGWLFIGECLGTLVVVALYLWRVNPEVVIARTSLHQGTKRWDKILLPISLPVLCSIIPVAALDDGRFHWFPLPWWVVGLGYILFLAGLGILTWAEAVNKFFEVTVRIQTDRGHKVIDTGPYAIVRLPGYVGSILFFVGPALCLGSLWALIPAGLVSALLILRTQWEDQTLQAELPGYKDYTQRVRCKLIPGVW